MLRLGYAVAGLLSALYPENMMTALEETLLVNPDQCVRQSFALSIIRAEGIVLVLAGMIGGKVISRIVWITGLFGALFVFHPRSYEQIASLLLYENAEDVEWKHSTRQIVRIIGIVYVLVAILYRSQQPKGTN